MGKFLLNLKQIVEKHQFECPTENSLQWTNAQKVLKEYAHGSALKPVLAVPPIHNFGSIHSSSPRKRPHQEDDLLRTSVTGQMLSDFFPREVTYSSGEREHEDIQTKDSGDVSSERSHIPDNFLVEPPPTPSPSPSRSPPPGHKSSQTARKDKKSPDSGMALTPSGSERDHRDGTSDTGSVGGASSRVTSPAPSISSVASSLSLAEAAKQMANTKRGSKVRLRVSYFSNVIKFTPLSLHSCNNHQAFSSVYCHKAIVQMHHKPSKLMTLYYPIIIVSCQSFSFSLNPNLRFFFCSCKYLA